MMSCPQKKKVPRWKEDQVSRLPREVEASSALVDTEPEIEGDGGCIERLIQECERKGLEQRRKRAKSSGDERDTGCMSRPVPPSDASLSAGSGLAAERAPLESVEGELISPERLLADSQCRYRVEGHWKSSMPEEPAWVEWERANESLSQACDGDSCRENCHTTYRSSTESTLRLAFEPRRIALEECCKKKDLVFVGLGEVLSRALAVVETRLERCSQPNFMLPAQDQRLGRTASMMVEEWHWAEVCAGLLKRGVCRVMHVSELHHVGERPLLNGMFAVSKNETGVDSQGNSFEVCRLIMNLVPTNGCCRSLVGDTSTLPSVVGMSSVVLEDSQLLITSSEEIRCFSTCSVPPPHGGSTWALHGRCRLRLSQRGTRGVVGTW